MRYGPATRSPSLKMASSIGFRMESFLPTLLFKLRGLDSYPGGTFTHCSCQPSLDAHLPVQISLLVRDPTNIVRQHYFPLALLQKEDIRSLCRSSRVGER